MRSIEKIEKVVWMLLVAAMIGLITFWAAGFIKHPRLAYTALFIAGMAVILAAASIVVHNIRKRNTF